MLLQLGLWESHPKCWETQVTSSKAGADKGESCALAHGYCPQRHVLPQGLQPRPVARAADVKWFRVLTAAYSSMRLLYSFTQKFF